MNRVLLAFALAASLIGFSFGRCDSPGSTEKIRVLIVDGQNNHQWQATTPHMKKWLESCGRFSVDVATTPPKPRPPQKPKTDNPETKAKFQDEVARFKAQEASYKAEMEKFSPAFEKYHVVVSNYNGDPWPAATKSSLEMLLRDGKIGLVIVHAANNSFTGNWPEYDKMIGMGWRGNNYGDRLIVTDDGKESRIQKGQGPGAGHGPRHPFVIALRDRSHPVVKDMPPEWLHAIDELYHGMRGPVQNVHLIATAFSDKKKGGTGEHEPMIWTVSFGKGRVFHTPMGHDLEAMRCVGFIATLQRGTEWAATGKVSIALPADFPTASAAKSVATK
jgi:type 1 glutamine amidotransferase